MRHILVMGPSGSGKTIFSRLLATKMNAIYLSVDHLLVTSKSEVVKLFCKENINLDGTIVIDYSCPLPKDRINLQELDLFVILMDPKSFYVLKEHQTFIPPNDYDICVTNFEFDYWIDVVIGTLGET